jgi:glycosyltransferase involved in cell wall biosynthesis
MPPLISVIIPVYNHAEQLPQTLASIAKQTHPRIEIIIVDDGSTAPIACPTAPSNIRCLRQENAGAPAARNRGFRESRGEYVIFWDADISAEPDALETMLAALAAHPDAGYAYANMRFGRKKMPAQPFDLSVLRERNYIHTASLIRRSAVVPWDETLKRFQDWDLWLTMAERGMMGVWVPEYLFCAAPHRGGMSVWLPRIAYRAPWKYLPWIRPRVKRFEDARRVIAMKHHLSV